MIGLTHLKFFGIKKMLEDNNSFVFHPFRPIGPSLPPVKQPNAEGGDYQDAYTHI